MTVYKDSYSTFIQSNRKHMKGVYLTDENNNGIQDSTLNLISFHDYIFENFLL